VCYFGPLEFIKTC